MHKKAMEMAKHAMEDACAKGYDCMTSQDWDNFKDCVETAEKMIKAEYYYLIVEEMKEYKEEEEAEEKHMIKMLKEEHGMSDDESKRYYDMWRYKSGRFAPKGHGTRRGYVEPPYWHIMPDYDGAERDRDVDRMTLGRMYYTEPVYHDGKTADMSRTGTMHDMKLESRMERARRSYTETKMHDDGTPEHKKKAMESLDHYMRELADDMTELVGNMDNSEKTMLKSKLQGLMQKIQ